MTQQRPLFIDVRGFSAPNATGALGQSLLATLPGQPTPTRVVSYSHAAVVQSYRSCRTFLYRSSPLSARTMSRKRVRGGGRSPRL